MMRNVLNAKAIKLSKDFSLNLLASLITTGVAQLFLYPRLAYLMSSDKYGELLTLMGIANTIGAACGGSLNNTRLLLQEKYDDGFEKGDFSCVLLGITCCATILSFAIFGGIYKQRATNLFLLTAFAVLCLLRSYMCVEYRIILDYRKVLLCNIWVAIGNVIGVFIYNFMGENVAWVIPFFIGESAGFLYVLKTTDILRERAKKTSLFVVVMREETILLVTSLSANILTYLDRIILLPLLGGAAVSYYTVASVFGKSVGILLLPLSSVLLSYYVKKDFKMNKTLFWRINIATISIGLAFALVSVFFAPLFTKVLYTSLYENAKEFVCVANTTVILGIVANMIQPSVLKFAPTFWQLIIQSIYCLVYLVGGFVWTQGNGLWGFAWAALVASIIKLVLLMWVGDKFVEA